MQRVPVVDGEIIRYAEQLRTENARLKEEVNQLRKELKNHINLCERRFQEIYPCISPGSAQPPVPPTAPQASTAARVSPFMQPSYGGRSLSSAIYK